jgi:hypothetical protein
MVEESEKALINAQKCAEKLAISTTLGTRANPY